MEKETIIIINKFRSLLKDQTDFQDSSVLLEMQIFGIFLYHI